RAPARVLSPARPAATWGTDRADHGGKYRTGGRVTTRVPAPRGRRAETLPVGDGGGAGYHRGRVRDEIRATDREHGAQRHGRIDPPALNRAPIDPATPPAASR